MPQHVEIDGVGVVEFPDSMNDDQIKSASAKLASQPLQQQANPSVGQIAITAGEAALNVGKQFVRGLPRTLTESLFPEKQAVEELGQAGRLILGQSQHEVFGENPIVEAEKTAPFSRQRFEAGFGLTAQLFGLAAGARTLEIPKTEAAIREVRANAIEKGNVKENIQPERARDDRGGTPAEAGGGGGVRAEAQGAEVKAIGGETPSETQIQEGQETPGRVLAPAEGTAAEPPAAAAATEPLNPVRGSGKFRATYQIDKEMGDRMEQVGASRETGQLKAEIASNRMLDDLTPDQQADVGKYLLSERLKLENAEHPQILPESETARIEGDPALKNAIGIYRNEIEPEVENIHKRAGVTEEQAAALRGKYISLVEKTEPQPSKGLGGFLGTRRLSRTTKFAKEATGGAREYESDVRTILGNAYGEAYKKANLAEFDAAAARKGLGSSRGGTLHPQLQHDLTSATQPEFRATGIPAILQKLQRINVGFSLTANPAELQSHMRRGLNIQSAVPPVGQGLAARLEALIPYIGPKVGTFARVFNLDFAKPEMQNVLKDVFDAGGGSTRAFSMYESKIPGIRQLQKATHNLLWGIPTGKGLTGWDLRMRVYGEMIRREVEGNVDPQRIREFANRLGQYGSQPDWFVRGLKKVNPYAATSAPMRLTELKQSVGTSGLKGGGAALQAETFLRGTGGTLLGLATANYMMSGHWPWDNEKGHEFDLDTGKRDAKGKPAYLRLRIIAPELSRPVATAGLPAVSKESTAKQPDYIQAFTTSLANQGLTLIGGPAQNTALEALTGKAAYLTKQPGKSPELLDIAKPPPGGTRGAEQLKRAAADIHPLGQLIYPPRESQPKTRGVVVP